MTAKPTPRRRAFITPLVSSNLLTPGETFPRDELRRRVLSLFWQDCCGVLELARAPAPIVELSGAPNAHEAVRLRLGAWWVLNDGIIEDAQGPYADRLDLFFGVEGGSAQLWPHYLFSVTEAPFELDMVFHLRAGVHRRTRISLESSAGGWVRVNRNRFSRVPLADEEGRSDFDLGPASHP